MSKNIFVACDTSDLKKVKKKYPVGVIKTKNGKIDICLTL